MTAKQVATAEIRLVGERLVWAEDGDLSSGHAVTDLRSAASPKPQLLLRGLTSAIDVSLLGLPRLLLMMHREAVSKIRLKSMSTMKVTGADFDASNVPDSVTDLTIERILKKDLPRLKGLERLRIRRLDLRWLSAPDLDEIPFPETLEHLFFWQSTSTKNMRGIERAVRLKSLVWRENVALEDGTALSQLPQLRDLEFRSDISIQPESKGLDFLRDLQLDRLFLNGVKGRGVDLSPIALMRPPKELFINGNKYPREELAKVAAANDCYFRSVMAGEMVPKGIFECENCSGPISQVRLKGIRGFFCQNCESAEKDRVLKALSKFSDLVEKIRAGSDK